MHICAWIILFTFNYSFYLFTYYNIYANMSANCLARAAYSFPGQVFDRSDVHVEIKSYFFKWFICAIKSSLIQNKSLNE